MRPALLDDEHSVYAFERRLHPEPSLDDVCVALHRGDDTVEVAIPVHWPDGTRVVNRLEAVGAQHAAHLQVQGGTVTLTLGPDEGAILVASD
jgi:hypothetical protein